MVNVFWARPVVRSAHRVGCKVAVRAEGKRALVDTAGAFHLNPELDAIGTPGPITTVLRSGQWSVLSADGQFQNSPNAMDTPGGNDGNCLQAGRATARSASGVPAAVKKNGLWGFLDLALSGSGPAKHHRAQAVSGRKGFSRDACSGAGRRWQRGLNRHTWPAGHSSPL